jgi:hypothetical protein
MAWFAAWSDTARAEIAAFLNMRANERHVVASTHNQALAGLAADPAATKFIADCARPSCAKAFIFLRNSFSSPTRELAKGLIRAWLP